MDAKSELIIRYKHSLQRRVRILLGEYWWNNFEGGII
jgi:hypothetical protein